MIIIDHKNLRSFPNSIKLLYDNDKYDNLISPNINYKIETFSDFLNMIYSMFIISMFVLLFALFIYTIYIIIYSRLYRTNTVDIFDVDDDFDHAPPPTLLELIIPDIFMPYLVINEI